MTEVSLKKYMPPIFVRYNAAIPSLMTKEERRGGLMIGIVYNVSLPLHYVFARLQQASSYGKVPLCTIQYKLSG